MSFFTSAWLLPQKEHMVRLEARLPWFVLGIGRFRERFGAPFETIRRAIRRNSESGSDPSPLSVSRLRRRHRVRSIHQGGHDPIGEVLFVLKNLVDEPEVAWPPRR